MALYPLDTAHDACRNTCTYLDEPCRLFDQGGDEVRRITSSEWLGLSRYLSVHAELSAASVGIPSARDRVAALDRAADTLDRLSLRAEQRGHHAVCNRYYVAAEVVDHLAARLAVAWGLTGDDY